MNNTNINEESAGHFSPYSWLKATPFGDVNFKHALKAATLEDLCRAAKFREDEPKNKTALKAIRAEINRRRRSGETERGAAYGE